MLIESDLGQISFKASADETKYLGNAKPGVFLVRVTDGLVDFNGQIVITPENGKLEAWILPASQDARTTDLQPRPDLTSTEKDAVEAFMNSLGCQLATARTALGVIDRKQFHCQFARGSVLQSRFVKPTYSGLHGD